MKFFKLISALMAVFLPVAALANVKMPSICLRFFPTI